MPRERDYARHAKSWPFAEARALLEHVGGKTPEKGYVLFETGYGPSGLPHIGTFAEVARTSMARRAFETLTDIPTRLFAFSDDMDGLRKVPDNIPNREMLARHLGKPLTSIPDPFGSHESFGHHNNERLKSFLDAFAFDYQFQSATDCYKSGLFDATLLKVLECYDEVVEVIAPTLGAERRATYSPFLPLSAKTGRVLQAPVIERHVDAGTIVYEDEDGSKVETPVAGGHCKLQWKVDWAMRWMALGVDYEMSGKDLIDSVKLAGKVCRILGGVPPVGFTYELFLDENGEKISKSRGNGLAVEEWLSYAPPESLTLFMYGKPKAAKRLYFDVIPRAVDDYLSHLSHFPGLQDGKQLDSPVWHIHGGRPPREDIHLGYGMLLNLASVCHTEDKAVLWHFITRQRPQATPARAPILDKLVEYAINYYQGFVKPAKKYRAATKDEAQALEDLARTLRSLPRDAAAETIQSEVYEVGKRHPFADLKSWFRALYEILLGQSQGPRMGTFIALYGIDETIDLIRRAVAGEDLGA
ncbi:MAG: lysine--tRNA ligase [Rhodospirillales bacterium]|jgi:lysyl-tRNA synthetase class 1|nr:lysine--tRNA ligase [Rhodospirillales bacterium]HIJ43548.1 lysine--tRNA ligase [Rhodospirillaceae bacterium]HIJ45553.1 lysine--tRNA ligase [Rhodospirillaceae bacterium]HIJ93565.1 lysine--tRNA ligase [Rhodospirillaceae bacterium]HJP53850.1 lysine--tRNA ligase [Rhodospirillales bacterium]